MNLFKDKIAPSELLSFPVLKSNTEMKEITIAILLVVLAEQLFAQTEAGGTFWKPNPRNYDVKHAAEIEVVPLVYLSSGYHVSLGYRYKKFRFRVSVIDAGTNNFESSGSDFERFETAGSAGIFMGYNVWKNLETYAFLDRQVFDIKQKSTQEVSRLNTITPGLGIGYQFFIGRYFYLQPALHLYLYGDQSVTFSDNSIYSMSAAEIIPVIRVGVRPWKKF